MLFESACRLLEVASETDDLISKLRSDVMSHLRVGFIPISTELRLGLLEPFLRMNPKVSMEVYVGNGAEIHRKLKAGELDVAFDAIPGESDLISTLVYRSELGLIIPPESPLFGEGPLPTDALKGQRVGLFPRESAPDGHDRLTQILSNFGMDIVVCPEWTIEGLVQFARQFGIPTLLTPDLAASIWPPDGLSFRTFNDFTLPWSLYFIQRRTPRSEAAEKLLRVLEKELQLEGSSTYSTHSISAGRPSVVFQKLRRLRDSPSNEAERSQAAIRDVAHG
jgi:DNA-binding transcriptional LysR family regulator